MRSCRNVAWHLLIIAGSCVLAGGPFQSDDKKTDETEPVYELGPGISAPRVTKQVNPEYPSKTVRLEGIVTLSLTVTSRGMPKDPSVVKGMGKEVDQSAMDAVKQWRFAPAQKDSKPVAVKILLEIEFHSM